LSKILRNLRWQKRRKTKLNLKNRLQHKEFNRNKRSQDVWWNKNIISSTLLYEAYFRRKKMEMEIYLEIICWIFEEKV
jgi:hypothetical protein